jgi:hypothetical protein
MALGAFIYICETLYKRHVAKRVDDGEGPSYVETSKPRQPKEHS